MIALLAMLIFGAPMAEGVDAITWPGIVRDAVGPTEAAARRLAGRHAELFEPQRAPAGAVFAPIPGCLGALEYRSAYASIDDLDLVSLLRRSRQEEDSFSARNTAVDELMALPRPVLGALDGCVRASAAAAVCDAWTAQRIRNAVATARPALTQADTEHARFVEQLACRIVGPKPPG